MEWMTGSFVVPRIRFTLVNYLIRGCTMYVQLGRHFAMPFQAGCATIAVVALNSTELGQHPIYHVKEPPKRTINSYLYFDFQKKSFTICFHVSSVKKNCRMVRRLWMEW